MLTQAMDEARERCEMTTVLESPTLTAADRCDRCGAQAYMSVRLPGGGELLFCGHHGRAHADALKAAGSQIVDESARLNEDTGSAARA